MEVSIYFSFLSPFFLPSYSFYLGCKECEVEAGNRIPSIGFGQSVEGVER